MVETVLTIVAVAVFIAGVIIGGFAQRRKFMDEMANAIDQAESLRDNVSDKVDSFDDARVDHELAEWVRDHARH